MPTPHDALFKLIFQHPEHAAAELRHLLPPEISRRIDWPTLRLLDGSRIDGELRDHHADLLYSVELRDHKGLLYIVLEHKSGPDQFAPLQFLRYAIRELETYHADTDQTGRLPYVMAVLVHHGAGPWQSGTGLLAISGTGTGTESESLPIPGSYLLNLPFLLDDLSSQSAASLRSRDMPALARLALLCLKRARHSGDFIGELRSWVDVLRMVPWSTDPAVTHLGLFRYIMEVTDLPYATVSEFLRVEVGPEAKKLMKTTYDKILEEGQAKGLAKGKAEGKAEGRAEGMATLLLGLLEKRFGPLSGEVVHRVRSAAIEQLERWAARVLTEETLDQVIALD
jgi:predicted transposase YdaD